MPAHASANQVSTPLLRRSLDRQAAEVLRQEIVAGRIAPGSRLVETRLSEQLQVSRGTVRSALSELLQEGLVEQVAYTKWLVPDLSAEEADELCSLRGCLEGLAARLAAERLTPESRERLETAFAELRSAARRENRPAVIAADTALHGTIVEISGHRKLLTHYRVIEQQVRRYIAASNQLLLDMKGIVEGHVALVEAIVTRDAESAERLGRDHHLPESRNLVDHLRSEEERTALAG